MYISRTIPSHFFHSIRLYNVKYLDRVFLNREIVVFALIQYVYGHYIIISVHRNSQVERIQFSGRNFVYIQHDRSSYICIVLELEN